MKIFDCFTYLDEDLILDLRLNILNKFVDKFIIVEAKYRHNGEIKKKQFNIEKFSKFKNKIEYIYIETEPLNLVKKKILDNRELLKNTYLRENYQRECISDGLSAAKENDFIIISDVDEIPNLNNLNFSQNKSSIFFFKQKMFYYKLNLLYENFPWYGSKACFKKNLIGPQWLRDVKTKKYPLWRLDTFFSKKKYSDINFLEDGGWHFTNIKSPKDIYKKMQTFLHNVDFKESKLELQDIEKMVSEKKIGYDHTADQRTVNKWKGNQTLTKVDDNFLPEYLVNNKDKYKEWLEINGKQK